MRRVLIFFGLLFLLVFSATAQDYTTALELTIDSKVISPIDFVTTGGSVQIDYLKVNFSWIPVEDYRQDMLSLSSSPSSFNHGDSILFELNEVKDTELKVSFRTVTTSDFVKVHEKVKFPITSLSSDLIEYTKPSELIDIDGDIRSQAASLAAGEDDLYVVVFKIADWVNTNIEYNLSTLTSEASLPSSWVLEKRKGVCDEISNLYVSMLRSLGIPARIVSGISYTDSPLFEYNWGAHGWTEVYFPDYGWVPFDPTYNQLGYVDATHIKLGNKKGDDRFNTQFTWRGKGFNVVPLSQKIESNVVEYKKSTESYVEIDSEFFKDVVDFGSYNVIKADVENKEDFYVTRVLDISRVEGVTIINEGRQDVLLKPGEKKSVYWIVKVEPSLDESYVYTFPVSIISNSEEIPTEGFQSKSRAEFVSYKTAQGYASRIERTNEPSKMYCTVLKDTVYVGKPIEIKCESQRDLESDIYVCIDGDCSYIVSDGNSFTIEKEMNSPGYKTFLVEAESGSWQDEAFVSVNIVDAPKLEIQNLEVDQRIKFDESSVIQFEVVRAGGGIPREIEVSLSHNLFRNEWNFKEIKMLQAFSLKVDGKNLNSKDNKFKILVEYYDDRGRRYFTTKEFELELYDLSIWQRISLWINDFEAWIK